MRSQGLILFKLEFIVIKFLNAFLYENNIFPVYLFIVSFRTIELYRQLLYYNFVVEKSSLLTRKNFQ